MMARADEPLHEDNIQLDFRLRVHYPLHGTDDTDIYICDGAEVFRDEHGIQWIKFFPKNGLHSSEEHMIRTDQIFVTRIQHG